jgi:hypothetical protein
VRRASAMACIRAIQSCPVVLPLISLRDAIALGQVREGEQLATQQGVCIGGYVSVNGSNPTRTLVVGWGPSSFSMTVTQGPSPNSCTVTSTGFNGYYVPTATATAMATNAASAQLDDVETHLRRRTDESRHGRYRCLLHRQQ